MGNITLKELALKLNLSISTVSKALNNSHEISNETKLKVQALADKYHYKPNLLAKSLKTGNSNTIGLIIPYISNPFQSQILEGAHQAALDHNYNLIFMQSRENAQLETDSLNALLKQKVDGIIISPSANSNQKYLKEVNDQLPLVLVDRIDFDINTPKIGVDSEKGAYIATQHLIDMGKKVIIVLTGRNIGVNQKRLSGYKKALLANHIDFVPDYIINVEYGQNTKDLIKNLTIILDKKIQELSQPIGILGLTDTLTVNTLGILANLGFAVPAQISVIGFANTEYAESLNPSLSTIVQPAFEMGYKSVEKLIDLIKSKSPKKITYEVIILESEIICRNSTVPKSISYL